MKIERIQHPDTSQNQRDSKQVEAHSKDTLTSNAVSFNKEKREEQDKKRDNIKKDEEERDDHAANEEDDHIASSKCSSGIDVVA